MSTVGEQKNKGSEQYRQQQGSFMEGDHTVPQPDNDADEPVEEKSGKLGRKNRNEKKRDPEVDTPSNAPERTEKKIPHLRSGL